MFKDGLYIWREVGNMSIAIVADCMVSSSCEMPL